MKNKDFTKLLSEIEKFNNLGELDDEICNKIKGEAEGGKKVEILWDDNESNEGCLFVLPTQQPDEYDACIHIPDADDEEYWFHLYELASFTKIKSITIEK